MAATAEKQFVVSHRQEFDRKTFCEDFPWLCAADMHEKQSKQTIVTAKESGVRDPLSKQSRPIEENWGREKKARYTMNIEAHVSGKTAGFFSQTINLDKQLEFFFPSEHTGSTYYLFNMTLRKSKKRNIDVAHLIKLVMNRLLSFSCSFSRILSSRIRRFQIHDDAERTHRERREIFPVKASGLLIVVHFLIVLMRTTRTGINSSVDDQSSLWASSTPMIRTWRWSTILAEEERERETTSLFARVHEDDYRIDLLSLSHTLAY